MRFAASFFASCLVLTVSRAFAVQVETFTTSSKNKEVALVESESPFPFEFEAEGTYIGGGSLERGKRRDTFISDFDGYQARAHFILTPLPNIGIPRLGVQTERYSFSY